MDPVPERPEDSTLPPLTTAQARGAEEVRTPLNQRLAGDMPKWVPRLLLIVVLTVFAAYATFMLIRTVRDLLLWLVAALFLSFALEPAVNYLVRRGWKRGAATGATLLGLGLAGVVTIAAMVPLVIDQLTELVRRAPELLGEASTYTEGWFGIELEGEQIDDFLQEAQTDIADLAGRVATIGGLILSFVFQALTIGLFTFYLVADGPRFRRTVCSLLTPKRQREVLQAWDIAIEKTGGYLYSRLLLAVVNGAITFVVLTVLGVPFALPLALWQGFVSQFIPIVGTYIAAAVPLIVALLEDPTSALLFLVFVAVYQQIENYLLAPRITARTMQLHPAVAFGAALAGGSIGGLLGAFMALPAAAVIQSVISSYLTRHEVVDDDLTRPDADDGNAGDAPGADDESTAIPSDGMFSRLVERLRGPDAERERTDTTSG